MPATGPAPHSGPGYQCELPRTMPGLLRWAAHLSWTPSRLEDRGWRGLGATCHLQALPCMPTDPRPPSPADPGKSWTLFPPRTSSLQTGEERAAAQAQVQGEGVGRGGAQAVGGASHRPRCSPGTGPPPTPSGTPPPGSCPSARSCSGAGRPSCAPGAVGGLVRLARPGPRGRDTTLPLAPPPATWKRRSKAPFLAASLGRM